MNQPQAILFDVDGVVIIPHPSFSAIFPREFGVDPELVTPFFKKDFPTCLDGQADLKEKITPWLSQWKWNKSVEELLNYWFSKEAELNTKVIQEVQRITQHTPCYIATNNEKYRCDYLFKNLQLNQLFLRMFSSCDLRCKKSDPQFWIHITQDLKLSPSQLLLIDDDPDNIACATAFGLQTYLFSSSVEDIDFLKTL